ncbi:MAG: (d)CMP kinase [Clostridia bacterium]|nr:(d)CMP kinase [Clostridia bacterium]
MIHINTEFGNDQLRHIYLKGARSLRPDLAKKISVAIDGPAGAGKSSVAKRAAKDMGYVYIDTGAMYRTVGVYGLINDIDVINKPEDIVSELDRIRIDISYEGGMQKMYLNGADVSERIREQDASMAASAVATVREVRARLVELQREMAKKGGVVMDGRDIGSVVLPDAELKIYLTASVYERAMRRYREYIEKNMECDFESLRQEVEARDKNDMTRAESPLVQTEDAVLLDTSEMNFEEAVAAVEEFIRKAEEYSAV